jgi:hypothetical protein
MTRVDRDGDDAVAAEEVRWSTRGVPVKAVAIVMTSASSRAVMAALMVANSAVSDDVCVDDVK